MGAGPYESVKPTPVRVPGGSPLPPEKPPSRLTKRRSWVAFATLTTHGATAGSVMDSPSGPLLPAELTTTMPAFRAFSMARDSGCCHGPVRFTRPPME